jgi:hypothetical protein
MVISKLTREKLNFGKFDFFLQNNLFGVLWKAVFLAVLSMFFLFPPSVSAVEVESLEKQLEGVTGIARDNFKFLPPPELEKEKASYVIMPIPVSNPTVGTGLGLVSMILYKAGANAPTSSTTLGGFYTSNESWAAGVSHKTYLLDDRPLHRSPSRLDLVK